MFDFFFDFCLLEDTSSCPASDGGREDSTREFGRWLSVNRNGSGVLKGLNVFRGKPPWWQEVHSAFWVLSARACWIFPGKWQAVSQVTF